MQVFEDAQGGVLERFGPESQATVEKWERDGKEYPFGILFAVSFVACRIRCCCEHVVSVVARICCCGENW